MLKNLGIVVRDELIDDLIKEATGHGGKNATSQKPNEGLRDSWIFIVTEISEGNGLMDEKEFRQWIQRIQSLQEESVTPSTSQSETDDDVTQDLIAAFRWENAYFFI